MGNDLKTLSHRRKRSVATALMEAEEDHLLDCPNADFFIRFGAFLLDLILMTLILTGLEKLCSAAANIALTISQEAWIPRLSHTHVTTAVRFGFQLLRIWLIYLYFLWTTMSYGGTPAKLLMGLRVIDIHNGKNLGLFRLLVREIAMKMVGLLLFGLGFLMVFFRKDRRALHDLVCHSVVKRVHGAI